MLQAEAQPISSCGMCLISLLLLFYKSLATQFWYATVHYGFLLFHRDLLQYCAALSLEKLADHFV